MKFIRLLLSQLLVNLQKKTGSAKKSPRKHQIPKDRGLIGKKIKIAKEKTEVNK